MDKIHFEFRAYDPDETEVTLEIEEDYDKMNAWKFHDFCKRFAYAYGFIPEIVEKIFGPTNYEEML